MRAVATDRFPELGAFLASTREVYGDRLAGIYLFGSRARGDNRGDSDYDVAVVLNDEGAILWREVNRLADLAFDSMLSHEILIQPIVFTQSDWKPDREQRDFVRAARRDAIELVEAR